MRKNKNAKSLNLQIVTENNAAAEQLRYLDLSERLFKNIGSVAFNEFIEISNAAESLIDYY